MLFPGRQDSPSTKGVGLALSPQLWAACTITAMYWLDSWQQSSWHRGFQCISEWEIAWSSQLVPMMSHPSCLSSWTPFYSALRGGKQTKMFKTDERSWSRPLWRRAKNTCNGKKEAEKWISECMMHIIHTPGGSKRYRKTEIFETSARHWEQQGGLRKVATLIKWWKIWWTVWSATDKETSSGS